jgi:hypothetical protein
VVPAEVDLSPAAVAPAQLKLFLLEHAELVHDSLNTALARQDEKAATNIVEYAASVARYAKETGLSDQAVGLFELAKYREQQAKRYRERAAKLAEWAKQKLDAEKAREAVGAFYALRKAEAEAQGLASGAAYLATEDRADLARAVESFSKIGQAAAVRRVDELRIDLVAKVAEAKTVAALRDLTRDIRSAERDLAARGEAVLTELKLDGKVLRNLGELAYDLLDPRKPDLVATLDILNLRAKYLVGQKLTSPRLSALRNHIEAVSLANFDKPTPQQRADRVETICRLGRETVALARFVPSGVLFAGERLELVTAGARIILLGAEFGREPGTTTTDPVSWNPHADYAVRALTRALGFGAALDPGGRARLTRAQLLLHRGLPELAAEEVRPNASVYTAPGDLVQLARVESLNSNPRAAEFFESALKGGFRPTPAFERDPDFAFLRGTKRGQLLVKSRDNPDVNVLVTMNPFTKNAALPSYDLKVVNKGAYPIVNANIVCEAEFVQDNVKRRVTFKPVTVEYLGPAQSGREERIIGDVFEVKNYSRSAVWIEFPARKKRFGFVAQDEKESFELQLFFFP